MARPRKIPLLEPDSDHNPFSSNLEYPAQQDRISLIKISSNDSEHEQKNDLIDAMILTFGDINKACEMTKIDISNFYFWVETDKNFTAILNRRKLEWEGRLNARAMLMGLGGHHQMLEFMLEYLNPWYHYGYRNTRLGEAAEREHDARQSLPSAQFLPPEIPSRFELLSASDSRNSGDGSINKDDSKIKDPTT